MNGETRIVAIEQVAIDQEAAQAAPATEHNAPPLVLETAWEDDDGEPAPNRWPALLALGAVLALALGWSALWVNANAGGLAHGGTPAQWAGWIRDWSSPLLLLGLGWLLVMRHSTREAARFGDAAHALGTRAAELEARLIATNRELSLAREFLAAQTRDLETGSRIAVERLSASAERLSTLVGDNAARLLRVDRIPRGEHSRAIAELGQQRGPHTPPGRGGKPGQAQRQGGRCRIVGRQNGCCDLRTRRRGSEPQR